MTSAPTYALRDGFLWGAATAAHQTEGNNTASNWWAMENTPGLGLQRSGDAVDSYHRYPEDMDLLATAGLSAYRFSIEWARIEPTPGEFSRAARAHYGRMVEACRIRGLTPVLTLHHFTVPAWFQAQGGWLHPDAAHLVARYVEFLGPVLADVDWVCTINEPNMIAIMSVVLGQAAGGDDARALTAGVLPPPDQAITDALLGAHDAARTVLRQTTDAQLGWTVAQQAYTPTPGNEDVFARVKAAYEDQFLAAGRDDDFLGVQAYTSQPVGPDGPLPHPPAPDNTLVGSAYRPDALGIALRNAWEIGGGTPLMVTENGIATADDDQRIAYTGEALDHLQTAVDEGVDVRGYLHWSLLDNYEWGHWGPTFGLVAVDRETFARTPKPSLAWLGDVARRSTTRH